MKDNPLVSVITATIGRDDLYRCIESVSKQTYKNYQHLIVVDGEVHRPKVEKILEKFKSDNAEAFKKIDVMYLPYPKKNWGGPVYSIGPKISKGDYICCCDDSRLFYYALFLLTVITVALAFYAFCSNYYMESIPTILITFGCGALVLVGFIVFSDFSIFKRKTC